jgi:hypothetical protein
MNAEKERPRVWHSHDPDFRWSIVADRRLGRLEVNIDALPDPDQPVPSPLRYLSRPTG